MPIRSTSTSAGIDGRRSDFLLGLKSGRYVLLVGTPTHEGQSRAQCRDAPIRSEPPGEVSIHREDLASMVDVLGWLSGVGGGRIRSRGTQKDSPT